MEGTNNTSTCSQQPLLPPGFRFHPSDEELVVHYLKKKANSDPLPAAIIAEIDLYKFDPWELPGKASFGENEWYFFTPRDRKYPNGARPNRAATSGYWKATGIDKPVWTAGGTQKVGVKKALVFYGGKPPKGVKTNWIMHEYRLTDGKSIGKPPLYDPSKKNKGSLRLDDWVLCRIYKKACSMLRPTEGDGSGDVSGDLSMNGILASPPLSKSYNHQSFMKPTGVWTGYNALVENHEHNNVLFDNMLNSNHLHHHKAVDSTSNLFPAKQSTSLGLFWNEEGNTGNINSSSSSAYTRMFLPDRSPMAIQPTATTDETMLLAPGETVFTQPFPLAGMNWYT